MWTRKSGKHQKPRLLTVDVVDRIRVRWVESHDTINQIAGRSRVSLKTAEAILRAKPGLAPPRVRALLAQALTGTFSDGTPGSLPDLMRRGARERYRQRLTLKRQRAIREICLELSSELAQRARGP